jgi:mediator of RNA polymerase II transcription subunit 31
MESVADKDELSRFQCDLEFLQFLSNPSYVQCRLDLQVLISKGFLADPKFLNYLQHLEYFKRPEFLRYVRYPVSLKMLEKLRDPSFVE